MTSKPFELLAALTVEKDVLGDTRVVFRSDTHTISSRPVVGSLRDAFVSMATAYLTLEIVDAIEECDVEEAKETIEMEPQTDQI